VLSLNASFMFLGFSLGAALGSLTLTYAAPSALGWVGGLCVLASLLLSVRTMRTTAAAPEPVLLQ
jgi:predicted MFS family arabinose efflux permease